MADQDYNRGTVGGTNWWDSTAAARTPVSDSGATVSTSGSSLVVFPPDHSMGLGLSSDQPPWNHPTLILRGEKAGAELGGGGGGGFRSMLQQGMTPFSATEPEFKPIKGAFSVDQPFLDTSSYGNFQALMGATSDQQGGGSGFGYHQQLDYGTGSSGGGWTNTTTTNKVDHLQHQFLKPNSMADKPNPSFWNMEAAMAPSSFFSPLIQQHQINIPCFEDKPQHNVMEVRDTSGPGRKTSGSSSEQTTTTSTSTGGNTNKRSRNEASSTLPPFKVRKEKMGDRITALQQLVSPFGKTDTASVLSEAIEYIKFLHEQVNVLSTPYLKSGASLQQQQTSEKDPEGARQDLRSRGLCLVPVSSTFPVAHETTVDFWTPTFGGTFR